MFMKNDVRCLRGLGSARYIVVGLTEEYLSQISYYTGIRLLLEKGAIRLFRELPKYHGLELGIQELNDFCIKNKLGKWSGFFLYTAWYKETIFIGYVSTNTGDEYFVKIFKNQDYAKKEGENLKLLKTMYGRWFVIPEVKSIYKKLMVLNFIKKKRNTNVKDAFTLLVKATKSRIFIVEETVRAEHVLNRMSACIQIFNSIGYGLDRLKRMLCSIDSMILSTCNEYKVMNMHGDMTPWNMYPVTLGKIALVDAERVQIRSVYSDFLHFIVQPASTISNSKVAANDFVQKLKDSFHLTDDYSIAMFAIYLMEELIMDANDVKCKRSSDILVRAMRCKLEWLGDTLQL